MSQNKNMHERIGMFVFIILFMVINPSGCAYCAPTDEGQRMVLDIPEVAVPVGGDLREFILTTPRVTITPGVFYELINGQLFAQATQDFALVSLMANSADLGPNIGYYR